MELAGRPAEGRAAGAERGERWVAVLSDIHANWEALQAVVRDLAGFPVEAIWNLGDTVGYGPAPSACVQWARERCAVSLLGNHDAAVVGLLELRWFNPVARAALEWTARQLSTDERLWLAARPPMHRVELPGCLRVLLAHGTPREPVTEYLNPEAARDALRQADFDVCLVGHTHLMGVYGRRGAYTLRGGEQLQLEVPCVVNVGSVGQPRDGLAEAGYMLLELTTGRLIVRRVAYDIDATQRAMREAGLPAVLAERLRMGW